MENKGNFSYIIKDGDKSTQEEIFKSQLSADIYIFTSYKQR